MRKKTTWTEQYRGVTIEIAHWREEEMAVVSHSKGVWNYYIYIYERNTPGFEILWLPDKLVKFTETSPEKVTHDYMNSEFPLAQVDWHGGITFYSKFGHSVGHRFVEGGCDYLHLWDEARNYDYSLEEVLQEAKQTADQLVALLNIQDKK